MGDQRGRQKFDNLQPIAFLKMFNKMVEEQHKQPLKNYKKQLKVFELSKFPLPVFYEKMEGIFEIGTKKKDVMNINTQSREDLVQQQFLTRHRYFMAQAIQKIIEDNENQQVSLENYKSQYRKDSSKGILPRHTKSEAKIQIKPKIRIKSGRNLSQRQQSVDQRSKMHIQKQMVNQEVENKTYLERVQIQRMNSLKNKKKEKIKLRDNKQVAKYIEERKTQRNYHADSLSNLPTGRSQNMQYTSLTQEDKKKQFIQEVIRLKNQQNNYQQNYASKIEQQIQKFNEKVKSSIQKTKKQTFW